MSSIPDEFNSDSLCPICFELINWNRESRTSKVIAQFISSPSPKNELDNLDGGEKNGDATTTTIIINNKPPCTICFGILESSLSRRVLDETASKFLSSGYDAETFNLALTLPPACFLRERLARLKRESSKNGENLDDNGVADNDSSPAFVLSLKDACRSCYQIGLEKRLESKKMTFDAQSDFLISIMFENDRADEYCSILRGWFPDRFNGGNSKKRKRPTATNGGGGGGTNVDGNNARWSRSTIFEVLPSITKAMIDRSASSMRPIRADVDECTYSIGLSRSPLFIGGRYCKYSRYLSQTPWVIDGVRRGHTSVQELICNEMSKIVGAEDVKFTSSGREDTDVRMLGNGRPFAVQLANCRRKRTLAQTDIDDFRARINRSTSDVAVVCLRVVTDREFAALKVGEEHKKKTYVALIWTPRSLNENDGELKKRVDALRSLPPIELEQKTPIRVLHRRPLAVRKRTVENFGVIPINDHHFQLRLTTQAGTYVKEFVHGDFGRTRPSLSDLLAGAPVDIQELDVVNIDLDWP